MRIISRVYMSSVYVAAFAHMHMDTYCCFVCFIWDGSAGWDEQDPMCIIVKSGR